ncbi:MAG: hypothetical protein ACFCA4_09355 [Cyanophyceae cyanobacterium]
MQIFDGTTSFVNNPTNFFGLGVGADRWLGYAQLPAPNPMGMPPIALATGAGTGTVQSDFLGTDVQTGYAGYLNVTVDPISGATSLVNPVFPTLDRTSGFRVNFSARVVNEISQDNRSGFSFIVLGSDSRGVEISFEGKNPGNTTDDFLFAQQPQFDSETIERTTPGLFDITQTQNYALTILGDTYYLTVGGVERLTGTVKLYDFTGISSQPTLPTDPYRINNLLFFGDNTDTGKSTYTLGAINVALLGAPTATGVGVSGTAQVGEVFTGNYTYSDPDLDSEAGSTFKWFRANNAGGTGSTEIPGATNSTYTLTATDQGQFIFFEITPRDNGGQSGAPILSAATAVISAAPTPTPTPLPIPPISQLPPPPSFSPNGRPDPSQIIFRDAATGITIIDGQPQPISFGDSVAPGTRRTFEIINSSNAPLDLDNFNLQQEIASSSAPLTLTPLSVNPIPPGSTATFDVALNDAVTPGAYGGTIVAQVGSTVFNFSVEAPAVVPLSASPSDTPVPIASDPLATLPTLMEVSGTAEGDILTGGTGNQLIKGFQGNDLMFGNQGTDLLTSGSGNDSLYGGQGDDWLFGREGNDFLSGDRGNDSLVGGPGADTFLLGPELATDTIFDFEGGIDTLQLTENLTFSDLLIADSANSASITVTATGQTLGIFIGVSESQLIQILTLQN